MCRVINTLHYRVINKLHVQSHFKTRYMCRVINTLHVQSHQHVTLQSHQQVTCTESLTRYMYRVINKLHVQSPVAKPGNFEMEAGGLGALTRF